MATTTNGKRNDRITSDQKMIEGVKKYLTQFPTLPVEGKNMAPADIVKVLQERIGKATAAQAAEAARTTAVKEDRDERASTASLLTALRHIVLGMFQANPDTLEVFGLKAPKVRKTKVAVKAEAVVKNKATRAARGTKGPKAKLTIKGSSQTSSTAPAPATPVSASPSATPKVVAG